tara:strand:- start:1090 stop:1416 length:327 start_codon:yes stop_codon:yes gene_type:complete
MTNFLTPILIFFLFSINSEKNLYGLWKSTDVDVVKYLKFDNNGLLTEIIESQTKSYRYKKNENFIEIELENGSSIESSFYINADTLTIQYFENGKSVRNQYLRKKLAL